jgi:hypothetical protein
VEWYWVWDTSTINTKALDDVKARARAKDASFNASNERAYASTTSPVATAASVSTVLKDVRYVIAISGTTSFTLLGADDNLPGTVFMASRNGTGSDGTGTVYRENTMMYNGRRRAPTRWRRTRPSRSTGSTSTGPRRRSR